MIIIIIIIIIIIMMVMMQWKSGGIINLVGTIALWYGLCVFVSELYIIAIKHLFLLLKRLLLSIARSVEIFPLKSSLISQQHHIANTFLCSTREP